MTRLEDYDILNLPGQRIRTYIGFGNEIRIAVDGNLQTPPTTFYPEDDHMVPFRPTVVMGPHRIAFVDDPIYFYGGYSYGRFRRVAINHVWEGTGSPTIDVTNDGVQSYPEGPQPAYAAFTWSTAGIYVVSLTVEDDEGESHTGTRQVIVYPSRADAYDGIIAISGISGAMDSGGWSCTLQAKGDLSFLMNARDLRGYIPVVVLLETEYETSYGTWERLELGPNWQDGDKRDDPRIVFSGYIVRGSIDISHDTSTTTFECRTADLILEQMQTNTYGFFESANDGSGIIFNDLMTHDVIRHMLQEHSNYVTWHDVRLFYNLYDTPSGVATPAMEYRDWTFNQGMYLSNIRDTAENQFERAYVDQRSCLFVTPDRNMWSEDLFYRKSDSLLARLGPEQDPIGVVAVDRIADQPVAIPLTIRLSERLSQAVAYYKLIASLSFFNEEWGAAYPKEGPLAGSGRWVLIQGKYYSDQDRDTAWSLLWDFAAKGFAATNARYTLSVGYGLHTYWRLGDIIEVVYDDPQGRVSYADPPENYFEVESISYDSSIEAAQWRTTYGLRELTTYTSPTQAIPPVPREGQGS